MKRNTLSLLGMLCSVGLVAQAPFGTAPASTDHEGPVKVYTAPTNVPTGYVETVVFNETFNNSLNTTNGQWTTSGANASLVKWDDQGPSGLLQFGWGPIPSPTASNGFALFDLYDNHSGTFADVPMECLLTSPSIPLSSLGTNDTTLMIEFYQQLFWCCEIDMDVLLEVSTDGGLTWPHSYKVNNFARNDRHWNLGFGYKWRIDISDVMASNPNNIQIRFNWTSLTADVNGQYSSEYFWMIDDIKISTLVKNSMSFTDFGLAPKFDMIFNGDGAEGRYGHMTLKQGRSIEFDANLFNFGELTQTNVALEVDIIDASDNIVTTLTSGTVPVLASKDTADFNQLATGTWTPTMEGAYRAILKGISDSLTQGNPEMPIDTIPFFVTDSVMSLDNGRFINAFGTSASSNNNPDGVEAASRFDFKNDERLFGVEIVLSTTSEPGGFLEVEVYDSTGLDLTAGFASNPIVTANHTLTQADIDGRLLYIDLTTNGIPAYLETGGYYVSVRMFSNNGQNNVNIGNDQTVAQQGISSIMFLPNPGRWFSGYQNTRTFNAPMVRAITCPAASASDCMKISVEELSKELNLKIGQNPENIFLHFNDARGTFNLRLTDINGTPVYNNKIDVNGAHRETISSNHLSTGVYILMVEQNGKMNTYKLIVQ